MQIIIDSKLYDTETATEIDDCFNSSVEYNFDGNQVIERLFRTEKGQWFMTCQSRGMAKRYHLLDNDKEFMLMDTGQALVWCEARKIEPKIVQQHFKLKEG